MVAVIRGRHAAMCRVAPQTRTNTFVFTASDSETSHVLLREPSVRAARAPRGTAGGEGVVFAAWGVIRAAVEHRAAWEGLPGGGSDSAVSGVDGGCPTLVPRSVQIPSVWGYRVWQGAPLCEGHLVPGARASASRWQREGNNADLATAAAVTVCCPPWQSRGGAVSGTRTPLLLPGMLVPWGMWDAGCSALRGCGMLSPGAARGRRRGCAAAAGGCARLPRRSCVGAACCQEMVSGAFPVCELALWFFACALCCAEFGWKLGFG